MFFILLVLLILLFVYSRLISPYLYWKSKGIFFVTPWSRLRPMLSSTPLPEMTKRAYFDHPGHRYFGSYQYLQPSLFVRDLALIKRIAITDFDHFTDHRGFVSEKSDSVLGLSLVALNGSLWRRMRATLSPAFSNSKMRRMFTLMAATAHQCTAFLVDQGEEVQEVEMRMLFESYANDVISNCAFGIEMNSLKNPDNEFLKAGRLMTQASLFMIFKGLTYGLCPWLYETLGLSVFPRALGPFLLRIMREMVSAREQSGSTRPDIIHLLMEARKGRLRTEKGENSKEAGFATVEEAPATEEAPKLEISDELLTGQVWAFFAAGFSTSPAVLSFMAYELAVNRDVQERLLAEIDAEDGALTYEGIAAMKYLDQVVCEAMRKWPPAFGLNRVCTDDYVIEPEREGERRLVVEKGCMVLIPAIALHYDPEYFPEPEKFDPERFSDENRHKIVKGAYMPFGMGPRNCIGSRFALMEMKTFVITLLRKFELVPIARTRIPVKIVKSIFLEAKGGMWIGLKRRN